MSSLEYLIGKEYYTCNDMGTNIQEHIIIGVEETILFGRREPENLYNKGFLKHKLHLETTSKNYMFSKYFSFDIYTRDGVISSHHDQGSLYKEELEHFAAIKREMMK